MKLYILHSWAFLFRQLIYMNRQSQLQQTTILIFFFFYLPQKTSLGISCESLADNSHEMSTLVFSENREINQDCRLPQILLGTLWVKCVHNLG